MCDTDDLEQFARRGLTRRSFGQMALGAGLATALPRLSLAAYLHDSGTSYIAPGVWIPFVLHVPHFFVAFGPFWTIASIRPGGSGWITALTTPPIFGSCASAGAERPQARRRPSNTRFDMSYLSQARPAANASQRPRARSHGRPIPVPIHHRGSHSPIPRRKMKVSTVFAQKMYSASCYGFWRPSRRRRAARSVRLRRKRDADPA